MIAIKRKNGDIIWMDAVLSFQESYSTSVTKHQIESGSTISDHVSTNNSTFNLSGVISGVEFSDNRQGVTYTLAAGAKEVNKGGNYSFVQITPDATNPLLKFLPESIGQFVNGSSIPKVSIAEIPNPSSSESLESIKEILIMLNRGEPKGAPPNIKYVKEVVTLCSVSNDGFSIDDIVDDCVLTSLSFSQDPETGDAIYPQMTFEQVRFVSLLTTKMSTQVSSDVKNKSSEKEQKGTKGEGASEQQNDGQQRTRNTGQDASFLYQGTVQKVRTR